MFGIFRNTLMKNYFCSSVSCFVFRSEDFFFKNSSIYFDLKLFLQPCFAVEYFFTKFVYILWCKIIFVAMFCSWLFFSKKLCKYWRLPRLYKYYLVSNIKTIMLLLFMGYIILLFFCGFPQSFIQSTCDVIIIHRVSIFVNFKFCWSFKPQM